MFYAPMHHGVSGSDMVPGNHPSLILLRQNRISWLQKMEQWSAWPHRHSCTSFYSPYQAAGQRRTVLPGQYPCSSILYLFLSPDFRLLPSIPLLQFGRHHRGCPSILGCGDHALDFALPSSLSVTEALACPQHLHYSLGRGSYDLCLFLKQNQSAHHLNFCPVTPVSDQPGAAFLRTALA